MTFTYDLTVLADPNDADYDRTWIRNALGDKRKLSNTGTPATEQGLLADEEIDALLADYTTKEACLVPGCDLILAAIAKDVDKDGAGIRVNRSQKTQHYRDLRATLAAMAVGLIVPVFTGDTLSEVDTLNDDTDYPGTYFKKDQFADPST